LLTAPGNREVDDKAVRVAVLLARAGLRRGARAGQFGPGSGQVTLKLVALVAVPPAWSL
jgi:hypothetical protein